jgi:anti-sigma factor RsiW
MSCTKWGAEISLYAGGDLPIGRVERVEQHLAGCADCRLLLEEMHAELTLLGDLRDASVDEAMLSRVRRRVPAETASVRPGWTGRRPVLLWAFAAALVLVAALEIPWRGRQTPMTRALRGDAAAPGAAPALAPSPKLVPARHQLVRRRRHAATTQVGPPLLVQFVTDDPNIVIYWLVDQKPPGD